METPGTGFFSEPVTQLPDMGPITADTVFPNQFEDVRPAAPAGGNSNADPFAGVLERDLRKGPSFEASTEPTFFNWELSNADRYVNSEYYKELGFRPDRDNETLYGERQTFWDTMQQAFGGGGELAWNTFKEGWSGFGRLVSSLYNWDATKLMGAPEDLEALDREQNRIMSKYAIFHTPESDSSIFSRQFFGDMVQQSGFGLGTTFQYIVEELSTAYVGSVIKSGLAGTKLMNMGKWVKTGELLLDAKVPGDLTWKSKVAERLFEGLKKANSVTKYVPAAGHIVDTGIKVLEGAKRGEGVVAGVLTSLGGLRRTMSEANMAFTESRMEAAGTYGALKDKLLRSAMEKGDVTTEQLQQIEDLSQKAAWSNFLVNSAVISIMNRFEYDNLFRKFGADKRATREMAEAGERAIKDAIDPDTIQKVVGKAAKDITDDAGKVTLKAGEDLTQVYEKGAFGTFGNLKKVAADFGRKTAAWEATKSLGRNLFKWEVGEGIQELVQEGSNIAIQNYYTDLYMGTKGEKGYRDYADKAIDDLKDINGLKIFLMGAVTGRLLAPIHRGIGFVRERATTSADYRAFAKKERTDAVGDINEFFKDVGGHAKESIQSTIEEYYNDPARFAPESVANLKAQNRASEVMEQALKDNDKYLYEHAKDGAFAKAVMAAKKLNMVESMTDTLRAYGDHFDENQFYEAFKVDFKGHEDRKSVKDYMNKLANDVQGFSDRYDLLRNKYADLVRPEQYAGEEQKKALLVQRALNDAVEWMAVSEYRAKRVAERGMKIIEGATDLPSVAKTAYIAFRVLGDDKQMDAEISLLQQELYGLRKATATTETTAQVTLKEEQLAALQQFQKLVQPYKHTKESTPVADYSLDDVDNMKDALKRYMNGRNKEAQIDTEVADADVDDLFFRLNDYRRLKVDERDFLDAYAFLAQPKNFMRTYGRIREGLEHLQVRQKLTTMLEEAAKKSGSESESGKQGGKAGSTAAPPVSEQQVRMGKPLESYHGYKVGDKVKFEDESEHRIEALTTEGVALLDSGTENRSALSLERFDLLVGTGRVSQIEGEVLYEGPDFTREDKKQHVGGVSGGIFIVKDESRQKVFYTLTDHKNNGLDADGKLVTADAEPHPYGSEEEAKKARADIVEQKEKEKGERERPFVFDGQELKHGDVLVYTSPTDGSRQRYRVVSEPGDAAVEAGKSAPELSRLELQTLGSTGTDGLVTIDSLKDYQLATKAHTTAARKEGAFRIPELDMLTRMRPFQQAGEDEEAAAKRVDELMRNTPADQLAEKISLKIYDNKKQFAKRLVRDGAVDENRNLQEVDTPLVIEVRIKDDIIGYLPYYDQYSYLDDQRNTVKIPDLTVAQFQDIYDTGNADPVVLLEEFKRHYEQSKEVYDLLWKHKRDVPETIVGNKLKGLFSIKPFSGDNAWTAAPSTPLDDLAYGKVDGKRVVLVQAPRWDDKGAVTQVEQVVVEGGATPEELNKLKDRIKKARLQHGYDLTLGMGAYQAVVELPNGELRFIPIGLPTLPTSELEALVQQINAQSQKSKKENVVTRSDGSSLYKAADFNGAFNAATFQQVLFAPSHPLRGLAASLSLNPQGDLLVGFHNPISGKRSTLLLQGGANGLAFANAAELAAMVNQAIEQHDLNARPGTAINLTVSASDLKQPLLKDPSVEDPEKVLDFAALGKMLMPVSADVVGPASISITPKDDKGDPLAVFWRKLAAGAKVNGELGGGNPPSQGSGGQGKGTGLGGAKQETEKERKKREEKERKEKEREKQREKEKEEEEKKKHKEAEEKLREQKKKEAVQKVQLERLKKAADDAYAAALLKLKVAAEKEQADAAAQGKKVNLDLKALRDAANQDPEVVALRKELVDLQQTADAERKALKVVTHDALEEADVEDIIAFEKWMGDNLPDNITLEVKNLIANNMGQYGITVGQFVYGMMEVGGVRSVGYKIVTDPKAPFKYHEAFHAVFRTLLSDAEIDTFLDIARAEVKTLLKRKGTTLAKELAELRRLAPEYYQKLNDEELAERYYEEHLADRFDAWKMDASKEKDSRLQRFFRWLFDAIREFVRRRSSSDRGFMPGELEGLFDKINSGEFKNASLAINRFTTDPALNVAPQVVLKAIKTGKKKIVAKNGEVMEVNEYLPSDRGTAVTAAVAGIFYERMRERRDDRGQMTDDSRGKGKFSMFNAQSSSVLEEVLDDFAKLYDKDNEKYLNLILNPDTIAEYVAMEPELEKMHGLFTTGRESVREAVLHHARLLNLMEQEEADALAEKMDELGDKAMMDYHKNKESIGGFDSLSKWMRQYIATTTFAAEDIFKNTELQAGELLLQAVDANRVYSGLLKLVSGTDNIHEMLLRMQAIAAHHNRGYAHEHTAHFINRFFTDMGLVVTEQGYDVLKEEKKFMFQMVMKAFQQYTPDYLSFSKELSDKDTVLVYANRREGKRKQFAIWANAFNKQYLQRLRQTPKGKQVAFFKTAVAGLSKLEDLFKHGKLSNEELSEQTEAISELLEKNLGLNLHPLFLQGCLLHSFTTLTPEQKALRRNLPKAYWIAEEDVLRLKKEIESGRNPFVWNKDVDSINLADPDAYGASRFLTRLLMDFAESNALFDETVLTTSFKNSDLEEVYAHQLPTFHLVKVEDLREELSDPSLLLADPALVGNFLLRNEDLSLMAPRLKLARIEGMNSYYADPETEPYAKKEGSRRKGVTYGSFTMREMLLLPFEMFGINELVRRANGSEYVTSRHVIRVLEASNTGDTVNLPIFKAVVSDGKGKNLRLSAESKSALVREVRREFERIKRVQGEQQKIEEERLAYIAHGTPRTTTEIDGFHNPPKPGGRARGLTLFKTGAMLGAELTKELEDEALLDQPNFADFEHRINDQLETYWLGADGQLDELIGMMVDKGILKNGKNGLENVLLPGYMEGGMRKDSLRFLEKGELRHNIAQVLLNDFLNTQAFNQILHGDQAESLMDFVDMVKRAKGANGSGASIAFDISAPSMNIHHAGRISHIIQFDDPKYTGIYAKGDVNKADAQMWMTVKSLRYVLFGLGKLTPRSAKLLDKLEHGEAVNVQEIFGKDGSVVYDEQTNSIKLVYYDKDRYIKISGFLLTKELTSLRNKNTGRWQARRGSAELHTLREKLEKFEADNDTICMAVPKSGSKNTKANTARGILPQLETLPDGTQRMVDPISDWNFQQLDNRFWRLQTETPSNKMVITDPTQAKQLIMTEQNDDTLVYFDWDGKGANEQGQVTVGQLKKIYMDETAQRGKLKYRFARDQMFTIDEAMQEIKTSADLNRVTAKLERFLKKAVEVLEMSGADSQQLAFFSAGANGHAYNLNHPVTLDKFTQIFLAYFTKGVLSEKIPGHSVTLASGYGLRPVKEVLEVYPNGQPKRWRPITRLEEEANPEEYKDALDWEGDVSERKYNTLAQRFEEDQAAGRKTYIVDDLRHNVPEFALDASGKIKLDDKGNEIILGYFTEYMLPPHSAEVMEAMRQFGGRIPDAIAKAFGVRIPSQDKHSFVNLKLIDFLPAHYGSTGIFAPELLEISGADFDADRVYMAVKEFYTRRPVKESERARAREEDFEDDEWFDYEDRDYDDASSEYGDLFYFYVPRKGEDVEFVEYGKASTPKERFNEYVRYLKTKDKDFRKEYQKFLFANAGYFPMQKDAGDLARQIDDFDGNSKELAELKSAHKSVIRSIKSAQHDATLAALRFFSLPDSVDSYEEKLRNEGEQNLGVLNNSLVDAKMQLLANEHTLAWRGEEPPIAFQVASVQPLKDLLKAFTDMFPNLEKLFTEGAADPDSIIGKVMAQFNNKEGAQNIGPAVNAMLAYALLNTFGIEMRDAIIYADSKGGEARTTPIWKFKLNGVEFNSYAHDRAYSGTVMRNGKEVHLFEGHRIQDHLSALVSAMTDNAKERLAAKLGLGIEQVGLVSNLVAQGVPLTSAVMLMLQPIVRRYYKETSNFRSGVKTEEEEEDNKYAVGLRMLEQLQKALPEGAEAPELTDALLRENIANDGKNDAHQLSVLQSFLNLRKQTQYFNDVSAVMKVSKGMKTSHEENDSLEWKMERLGLHEEDDETFNQKYVPFDLRQVLTGRDASKPHNPIVSDGLKHFMEIRKLSEKVFIERTELFRDVVEMATDNFRVRGFEREEFHRRLKKDLLAFLNIKAYMKKLWDNDRLERAVSLSTGIFKEIVPVVRFIQEKMPDNLFVHQFLNVLPANIPDEDGFLVQNPFNRTGVDRVEINTWSKLDAHAIEQLQYSFLDILEHPDTHHHAWALFHYLLVRDGGVFRNGSFIRYLPTSMFKDLQDSTSEVNEVLMAGFPKGNFDGVFGMGYFDLLNEFLDGYLTNVTNTRYVLPVDIEQSTKSLPFKGAAVRADLKASKKPELKPEELEEVRRYVPETFVVSEDGNTITIDMTGGIRADKKQKDSYDPLERAKYAKNIESLELRGFWTTKIKAKNKSGEMVGDEEAEIKKSAIVFPFVLRQDVVTPEGNFPVLFKLVRVDEVKRDPHDPKGYFPGSSVAAGSVAVYERYGRADGHRGSWAGVFMFGDSPVGLEQSEHGDLRMENGEEDQPPLKLRRSQRVNIVEEFMEQYGVDNIDLVPGKGLVFFKNGVEAPDQEGLYEAFLKMSQEGQAASFKPQAASGEPGDPTVDPAGKEDPTAGMTEEEIREYEERQRKGPLGSCDN
jgi:FtsZ-interacting cell division protein YlmF